MDRSKWEYKKLGDICDKGSSNIAQNKIEDNTGDYALYGASGYVKGIDFYHQEQPYIGVVKDGSGVGRVNKYPAKSSLLGTMQYIFPKECCDLGYLLYVLQGLHLEKYKTGAAIPHIYFKDYCKCEVPFPSIADQQRIVAELDCLNEMIAVKQEQLKEFDKLAQSIFYDMFGDPLHESKWDKVVLGEVCKTTSGGTPSKNKSSYYEGGNIGWLRSGDITTHIWENKAYITKEGMDNSSAKLFPVNTVVVAMYGATVGQVGILHIETTTNQAVCGIFPNKNIAPTYLCYHFMCIKPLLIKNAIGGAQPNISQGLIKSLNVPLPPLSLQQQFADKISAIEAQKELVKQSIAETQALLDYSMDYYFNE